jgi:hypothetical protein
MHRELRSTYFGAPIQGITQAGVPAPAVLCGLKHDDGRAAAAAKLASLAAWQVADVLHGVPPVATQVQDALRWGVMSFASAPPLPLVSATTIF